MPDDTKPAPDAVAVLNWMTDWINKQSNLLTIAGSKGVCPAEMAAGMMTLASMDWARRLVKAALEKGEI